MNTEMDIVIAGLIGFVIGTVLMVIIGRGNKGKKDEELAKLQAELAKLQAEYDSYREEVNAHFAKTADAVDNLTKSYQQVFEHLSDGAHNLMGKKALQNQFDKRQGKAVTFAYLVGQEEKTAKSVADESTKSVANESTKPVANESTKSVADESIVSKIESLSAARDRKQTIGPMVKTEAPVPVEEKAEVIAYANTVKTPVDTKSVAQKDLNKPEITGDENISTNTAMVVDPKNTLVKALVGTETKELAISKEVKETSKTKVSKEITEFKNKSNVHQAAENAGLRPAETIVKINHHESAIDSVKKYIKDDNDKESQA